MSRHIFITLPALKKIIRDYKLQSPEFDESNRIIDFIIANNDENFFYNGISHVNHDNEYGYIYTKDKNFKEGVVFDIGNLASFREDFKLGNSIHILQKTLKYAIKFFNSTTLAPNERNINNDFTIIFPFKFSAQKNVFKILTYKNPLKARMDKRDRKYLYVFKDGVNESSDIPSLTKFRKCLDFTEIVAEKPHPIEEKNNENSIETMSVISLGEITYEDINGKSQDNTSKLYFTKQQAEFINKPFSGCERLQGAAGTGKTVTLVLRTINNIKKYVDSLEEEQHLIFITHSIATKKQIVNSFEFYYPKIKDLYDRKHMPVSLKIITLQEWCLSFLGTNNITDTEYLDKDAQNSKELQLLYILEAYDKAIKDDFESYKPLCSDVFINFIESHSSENILELLQSEIGVTIKGRARQELEMYLKLSRLDNSIPARNKGDFNFLFLIYQYYQSRLSELGQFDSDDIVLSALGKLSTPIWRRRREEEGYDSIVIDETHLFNVNELSIIHHLTKPRLTSRKNTSIIFAIDKSQAIGNTVINREDIERTFQTGVIDSTSQYKTVFRSSPQIINLAFSVLSSGSALFTNFENPLEIVHFAFTHSEESKSTFPTYYLYSSDKEMIEKAFNIASTVTKNNISKSRVLLVASLPVILEKMVSYATEKNKPIEVIKRRGDTELVNKAARGNKFVLAGIDYIGGLEFDAVILVGIDEGRVPQISTVTDSEGYHFNNYAWHNRLYVAITRARYQLYILGNKSRGVSPILKSAIADEYIISK